MSKRKWLLAIPLAFVATLAGSSCLGGTIIDGASLFSAEAIQKAGAELNRVEAETRLPVTIETVESLGGEPVNTVLRRHAESARAAGVYVLIAKQETKFDIEASRAYRGVMNAARLAAIKASFVSGLKKRDFDAALLGGVETIRSEAGSAGAVPAGGGRRGNPQGGFGVGSLLGIGLLIVGVMFLVRILGGLFGGGAQAGYGSGMGRMGAPGYGGGGGGGFMSSLFGGIGGALAGNWLYDQFSGRGHSGYNESSGYGAPDNSGATDWSGGSDQSADWGGGGGTGAGGDWGGGGGGDWGGGGGGGDW